RQQGAILMEDRPMIRLSLHRRLVVVVTLLLGLAACSRTRAYDTYLALGDSLAFGESLQTGAASNGDQGYVAPFADYLATTQGGVRPNVVNLAVNGETSATFFNRGTDPHQNTPIPGQPSYFQNTNYDGSPSVSQNALMVATAQGLAASGHTIDTVTLQLGANDFLQYVYGPTGLQLPSQVQIGSAVQDIQTNLAVILTEIKALAPTAHIYVLGYYNAFQALPLLDPTQQSFADQAGTLIVGLNQILAAEAAYFGASYVDLMPGFDGKIPLLTQFVNMPGNVHPNAAGYEQIAQTLAAVPEPGSLALCALGFTGLTACRLGIAQRRRSKSA
ncbi:MAG TPA: GDSL-type esterase/lipase family protein, partial [Isosphaeraceae bacterium]|nr:GDSL-type esterase/lipase family protein [Isosphaeraceae bacterium]